MGRPVNRKCFQCAFLLIEDVKEKYGDAGEGCWDPKICHRRRSHYRHRQDNNAKRRRTQSLHHSLVGGAFDLSVPMVPAAPSAVLVLYRRHTNAPIHAIAAEVWQGDIKIAGIKPVHCMGLKSNQVKDYLQAMLDLLTRQFGIHRFEDTVKEYPVEQCPITPCPLKS